MILHQNFGIRIASVCSPLLLDTILKGKLKYPDSQTLLRTLAHSSGSEPWLTALNYNPCSAYISGSEPWLTALD